MVVNAAISCYNMCVIVGEVWACKFCNVTHCHIHGRVFYECSIFLHFVTMMQCCFFIYAQSQNVFSSNGNHPLTVAISTHSFNQISITMDSMLNKREPAPKVIPVNSHFKNIICDAIQGIQSEVGHG